MQWHPHPRCIYHWVCTQRNRRTQYYIHSMLQWSFLLTSIYMWCSSHYKHHHHIIKFINHLRS